MTTGELFELRVGTCNLLDGGLDGPDERRLNLQVELLADRKLDLLGLQEAKWAPDGSRRLHQVAHRLEMSGRFLVPSNHHGCDLVMLCRESERLRVIEECHDTSGSFWHARGHLRLEVAGLGEVDFLNDHFAPSSIEARVREAQSYGLFAGRRAVAVGDFNGRGVGYDDPDVTGFDLARVGHKLDRRPAEAIARVGFTDAAACAKDPTPTVGHSGPTVLPHRSDWILFNNLPDARVTAYEVLSPFAPGPDRLMLSDHCIVVATIAFRLAA